MKLKILTFTIVLLTVFTGCSDNKEEKDIQTNDAVTSSSTPKIEVIKNKNAREIKVQEKEKVKDKSQQANAYYYDYNIKSEYNQNAKPANKDASVREKPRTSIDANMHVRSPYEEVQVSLLVRKLSKKFIVKCSACHNDYANGIIGPSLLGKDSNYIYSKIENFKNGKKSNPLMNDLIKMMSDKEIKDMADEVYRFNQEIKMMRK